MVAWILANRTLTEIAAVVLMIGAGYAWWVHHDHVEQALGEQACEQKLTITKEQASIQAAAATKAAQDAVNQVVAKYEAQTIDPVVPGIAGRLRVYTLSTCALSGVPAPASTVRPAEKPGNSQSVESSLTAHLAACADDAEEVIALREAWNALAKAPAK